jgi:hypothetical protein
LFAFKIRGLPVSITKTRFIKNHIGFNPLFLMEW